MCDGLAIARVLSLNGIGYTLDSFTSSNNNHNSDAFEIIVYRTIYSRNALCSVGSESSYSVQYSLPNLNLIVSYAMNQDIVGYVI